MTQDEISQLPKDRLIALAKRPITDLRSPVCRNGDCGESSRDACSYCSCACREDHKKK